MIALLAHLTAEDKTDIKIGLAALFALGVFRVACWAYDTRNDFERPLRHHDPEPQERNPNGYRN